MSYCDITMVFELKGQWVEKLGILRMSWCPLSGHYQLCIARKLWIAKVVADDWRELRKYWDQKSSTKKTIRHSPKGSDSISSSLGHWAVNNWSSLRYLMLFSTPEYINNQYSSYTQAIIHIHHKICRSCVVSQI